MTIEKRKQGTPEWFDMVGRVMSEAARKADLPADSNVSLVERYTDPADFGDGLVQGFRFAIVAGQPSCRVGAKPGERGDVTVEVSAAAARDLNAMPAAAAAKARRRYIATGELRQEGDPAQLGEWFGTVHRAIVDRTD